MELTQAGPSLPEEVSCIMLQYGVKPSGPKLMILYYPTTDTVCAFFSTDSLPRVSLVIKIDCVTRNAGPYGMERAGRIPNMRAVFDIDWQMSEEKDRQIVCAFLQKNMAQDELSGKWRFLA